MGIVNITPDSFYQSFASNENKKMLLHIEKMMNDGVDIIDVGAMSSRPKAELISEAEEENRLLPALEIITKNFPELLISIDTFRANIAQQAIDRNASIINDISAGNWDEKMLATIAKNKVPYIAMHGLGKPFELHQQLEIENITTTVYSFFNDKIAAFKNAGIIDVILDVGFGFSKTLTENYQLIAELNYFKTLELPLLIGISRKSMITKLLQIDAKDALSATSALHLQCLIQGAKILRVHDVKEAKEVVKIYRQLQNV